MKARMFGQVECPNHPGIVLGMEQNDKGAVYGVCVPCKKRWLVTNWHEVDLVKEEKFNPLGDEENKIIT